MQKVQSRAVSRHHAWHAAVIAALPRDMDARSINCWIKNSDALSGTLHRALVPNRPAVPFLVWQVIKNRAPNPISIKSIRSSGIIVSDYTMMLLARTARVYALDNKTLTLTRVSVGQLCLTAGATYDQICTRASELGLILCPAQVGCELVVRNNVRADLKELHVAMQPITAFDRSEMIFKFESVYRRLEFGSSPGHTSHFYDPKAVFVFVLSYN